MSVMLKQRQSLKFEVMPVNLRTYYFRQRQDIEYIWQEKDGDWFVHFFCGRIDTWAKDTKGWHRTQE